MATGDANPAPPTRTATATRSPASSQTLAETARRGSASACRRKAAAASSRICAWKPTANFRLEKYSALHHVARPRWQPNRKRPWTRKRELFISASPEYRTTTHQIITNLFILSARTQEKSTGAGVPSTATCRCK